MNKELFVDTIDAYLIFFDEQVIDFIDFSIHNISDNYISIKDYEKSNFT